MSVAPLAAAHACTGCGTELAHGFLACPRCQRLVYAERLSELRAQAQQAVDGGDVAGEVAAWREALTLLPASARQHAVIAARVDALSSRIEKAQIAGGPKEGSHWAKILAPLGAAGLLLWKLKFLFVGVLSKAKLLVLGLTKGTTLFTMLASFALYWTAWGWKFALGLVGSIYVHEMGHVAALRKLGIKATAPMFVPGLGAFVRMQEKPAGPREDARVGLAGPWWGLGAAVVSMGVHAATGMKFWLAIAHTGAWINLFNLLPVWQLDGGRGANALSRLQRILLAITVVALWVVTREGLLVLLGLAVAWRVFQRGEERSDWRVFAEFAFLLVALAALIRAAAPV
jgi:Zn-dependent protease